MNFYPLLVSEPVMLNSSILRPVLNWLAAAILAGAFVFVYLYNPSTVMSATSPSPSTPAAPPKGPPPANLETAVFATGCFWCSQAVLERLPGVWEATCGYIGGTVVNPTYEQVCTGKTGHAEATLVKFDPKVISYDELLEWFWHMHDPTTLNRQGYDEGTQYRSAIFYFTDAQKATAEKSRAAAQKDFKDKIVTEITKASVFYTAESYHQEYFNSHPTQGYCQGIISPKLAKLKLTLAATTAGTAVQSAPPAASGTASPAPGAR